MIDRRTFLLTTLATNTLFLSGCGESPNTFKIALLQGSIPLQLIGNFRRSVGKESPVQFYPQVTLQKIFQLLETWQKPNPSPNPFSSFINSLPLIGKKTQTKTNITTLSDSWLKIAIEKKLIQPIDIKELEGWSKLPPNWRELVTRNERGAIDTQGKIYGAPYRFGNMAIAYRQDKLEKLGFKPKDWEDLWNPQLKGRISLLDNYRLIIGLTLKKLGYSFNTPELSKIKNLELEIEKLHQQALFYSSNKYLEPLILGDTWMAVGWSTDILPLTKRSPNIKVIVPRSGTSLWMDIWVQPTVTETIDPDTLSELKKWIEFCWQPLAANQIAIFTEGYSPISIATDLEELTKNMDDKEFTLATFNRLSQSEFIKELNPKSIQEYQSLWKKIRQINN